MWFLLRTLLWLLLVLAIAAGVIYATGMTERAFFWSIGPWGAFDDSKAGPAPDYSDPKNWAALPETPGMAAFVPQGVLARDGTTPAAAAVFFVHPTGYLNGASWNSPIDLKSKTEENTTWMMANQASAYNGCCDVYAPRYREASFSSFLDGSGENGVKALDLAYRDVARAFEYFVANHAKGRPFILASHSQGTRHALRLIQETIDGTPLRDQMVAAYIIGSDVRADAVLALKTVKACNSADDLNCLIHWGTFGDGAPVPPRFKDVKLHCTNPLSWTVDGPRADESLHKGAVPPSGKFQNSFYSRDEATGVRFDPLGAPLPKTAWAECKDGLLFVKDQAGGPMGGLIISPKNYHGLDYPLFHMDIRDNAILRVNAYLNRPQ